MRLFIAAELPRNMREALAETSALLRERVRGRYVAPDSFHVTLAFLGDVAGTRVDDASYALDRALVGLHASEASLGELGSFGKRSRATLWQGFGEPGVLPEAADCVRAELRAAGFSFDEKRFLPHVTLMRAADLSAGTLPAPCPASGTIGRITLFCSDLSGPRPVYEALRCVELAR